MADLIKQLVDHLVGETLIGGRQTGDMVVDGETAASIEQFKNLLAAKLRTATPESEEGGSSYLVAEATLTNAEIKGLPLQPYQLVAAPGANKILVLVGCAIHADIPVEYTNVSANRRFYVQYGGTSTIASAVSDFGTGGAQFMFNLPPLVFPIDTGFWDGYSEGLNTADDVVNKRFDLTWENEGLGDLTGGDDSNSMKIKIVYYTMDV